MLSIFEKHKVSFVAVTQQFNTSTSLGRLTLNILLSFAQFERELIGEGTRDKMSAVRKKGRWVGGCPVLGYDVSPGGGALVVNEGEAEQVRSIFKLFEQHRSALGSNDGQPPPGYSPKSISGRSSGLLDSRRHSRTRKNI